MRGQHQARRTPLPRAPKLCADKDCIALVHPPLRYCPEHTNRWKHSPRTVGAKRCSTTEWKQQRIKCLQRDERKCQIRGPRCTVLATEVDHVIAVAFGGSDGLENLQAACHNCHATKSGREGRSAQ
ncbi:HNH endonuclease [Mycobacteroides abscessus]|uniref:HNH endonuclease n=1 Tax=Mycobacteroides abscessus TaxID=36809 RepID=UPI0009A8AB46